jgi:intracellular multiplication protein IcmF
MQLPEPISTWVKQLADDAWYLVMNDAKHFINYQWQHHVFQTYQQTISNRYPFDSSQIDDVSIGDFNRFFSSHGILQSFIADYLKPFLDTTRAEWHVKDINNYMLPISNDMLNELMRANVITAMFFPTHRDISQIEFSLQKMNLDPIISHFELSIGNKSLNDTQRTDSLAHFQWPETGAKLTLSSIEGQQYELDEHGPWAFFKMLQKVNVLVDKQDSSMLQILFEINGNSGRYLLKTASPLNPFTPGILSGFSLNPFIANT